MKPFLDLYLDFTKEFESPSSFWRWSAYTTVAAILRDRVFLENQEGGSKIYPNIFVVLVAPSGERKDAPVTLSADLVRAIRNTKLIEGRTSIEALCDALGKGTTSEVDGKMIRGGSCLISAPELSAAFVNTDSLVPVLTNMYSYKASYKPMLVGRETHEIKDLCVSMLAASNEPLMREIYNGLATQGGLLGRTFLVRPDERRPPNPLFESSEDAAKLDPERYSLKILLHALKEISNLKGTPKISKEAALVYTRWYKDLRTIAQTRIDACGIYNRIHTGVKKLALIIAASTDYQLCIDKIHIERAIDECTRLLDNYNSFAMQTTTKTPLQDEGAIFLNTLWKAKDHTMTKREYIVSRIGMVDLEMLEKIVSSLDQGGFIRVEINGSNTVYTMKDKGKEIYERETK